jgi:mono/diheme cytochrome c family protein
VTSAKSVGHAKSARGRRLSQPDVPLAGSFEGDRSLDVGKVREEEPRGSLPSLLDFESMLAYDNAPLLSSFDPGDDTEPMKKTASIFFVLVAIVIAFAPFGRPTVAAPQGKTKPADGKGVYQSQCAKCHADDGKGIPSLPDIPNFADAKWQASRTDKKITDAINVGAGIMPGFKEVLSAAEVRAVVKQVRAFGASAKTK